ncbi:MAG: hypothetical protein KF693_08235 [Nitrospira sp.]|nr:hypothetical protein [Nitrospira sp.]
MIIAFLLFAMANVHSTVLAAGNITVNINGLTCSPALTPGLTQVLIATHCPSATPQITITDLDASNKARVITEGVDSASDILTIKNALITANTTLTNFHIIFKKQFDSGPNSPPNVYYKPHLYGKMTAVSPNKITATYRLKDSSGNILLTSSLTHMWSEGANINKTKTPAPQAPNFSGARTLEVDLNIENLTAGSTLDFRTTNPFMKYHNQAFPQDPPMCLTESDTDYDPICGGQSDPEPTATPLLDTVLKQIGPGREGCLGIYFPNSGCVGVYIK